MDDSEQQKRFEFFLTEIRKYFPQAQLVKQLINEEMFSVPIDSSEALNNLIRQAQELRDLPFDEKLKRIVELTKNAIPKNAVELSQKEDQIARQMVFETHSLSEALKTQYGCCRYQAVLFFILAREASLGKIHYMATKKMGKKFFTVYNLVFDEQGQKHLISIYNETLSDPNSSCRYPEPKEIGHEDFSSQVPYYAYFSTPQGLLTIKTPINTLQEQQNWGKPITV